MSMERKIRLIAGTFILISLGLGWWVSPYWFLFTAFVGVNLIQSSLTRWCLMEDILCWTGVHKEQASES
ncbi:MAG: DUF2892 domain-containing protein [Gemmatimonadetes bacterium]|nr:DUF2892 domain-containing protein [Gemmatimonadota bacterium]